MEVLALAAGMVSRVLAISAAMGTAAAGLSWLAGRVTRAAHAGALVAVVTILAVPAVGAVRHTQTMGAPRSELEAAVAKLPVTDIVALRDRVRALGLAPAATVTPLPPDEDISTELARIRDVLPAAAPDRMVAFVMRVDRSDLLVTSGYADVRARRQAHAATIGADGIDAVEAGRTPWSTTYTTVLSWLLPWGREDELFVGVPVLDETGEVLAVMYACWPPEG